MIIVIGLVILVAAVIAGVAGILSNGGHAHAVTHFAVFGYHVTGSTGTLFVYGIVVGALALVGLALVGLSLVLAGARRTSRRGRDARRGLAQSRRETAAVSQDRDDMRGQRDLARAGNASTPADSTARNGTASNGSGPGKPGLFTRRPARPQAAAPEPEPPAGQAPAARAADIPASAPAPG